MLQKKTLIFVFVHSYKILRRNKKSYTFLLICIFCYDIIQMYIFVRNRNLQLKYKNISQMYVFP